MILYFSGTGNSRYAAELIASVTVDELVSLNKIIKDGKEPVFNSDKPFVVVCPTYAWRIPKTVEALIRKSEFKGSKDMYFYLTCGGGDGNSYGYAKKLCDAKGLNFKGLKSVVMPENYIAMFNAPDKAAADKIIENARPKILRAAQTIKSGGVLKEPVGIMGKALSTAVNPIFYPLFVSAKGFYADDKCVSCGKCAEVCPLNNIVIADGKPVWSDNCTHCMACICLCPAEAIEYKNKSKGKPRYHICGVK